MTGFGLLTPARQPHAATVPVEGEAIVVDEVRGIAHLLNATGALVWECFDGVSSLEDIVTDLVDIMGADPASTRDDVARLAVRLLDSGVAAAPGYERPPFPEELFGGGSDCGCGDDDPEHDHDVDPFVYSANP